MTAAPVSSTLHPPANNTMPNSVTTTMTAATTPATTGATNAAAAAAAAAASAPPVTVSVCTPNAASQMAPKLPTKGTRTGSSSFRQLLPIGLCLISFATVLSVLIIYMDTTEIRHQQFRLNMSRDYDITGIPQDNKMLVNYVREVHMRKYPMAFMRNAPVEHLNFTDQHDIAPDMARYIGELLGDKKKGVFMQSVTGLSEPMATAPWLAETLDWGGALVEPDPRKYFMLRKQNAHRPRVQVIHACLSPNKYPKEVTLQHEEESDVRINSILEEETEWFHSRVKCFPLYTLMLATNRTEIDLLSMGCQGQELQILETLPYDQVKIQIISIHMYGHEDIVNLDNYIQSVTQFLATKSYKLMRTMINNYIYQLAPVVNDAKTL